MIRALALVLVALAAWWVVPPWRDERAGIVGSVEPRSQVDVVARIRGRAPRWGPAARRRATRERARTVQALGALAAELESGQSAVSAIVAAGGEPCVWPTTVAALAVGEDPAAALLVDAQARPGLLPLAACWQISSNSGSGFALAVGRLAASARAAEVVRVDLEGELAGPRATGRLLASLPVVGVGFGVMLGADPLSWLVTTAPGLACLAVGITLTVVGMIWTGRIAAAVERLL